MDTKHTPTAEPKRTGARIYPLKTRNEVEFEAVTECLPVVYARWQQEYRGRPVSGLRRRELFAQVSPRLAALWGIRV